ncbi:MAG: hypothetical protein MHPSP_000398 [Paramarteilia canceri]
MVSAENTGEMKYEEANKDEQNVTNKIITSKEAKCFSSPSNPQVFFDIKIGTSHVGRMIIELFANVCPKTCENFRQFCTGQMKKNGIPIGYKNSRFHKVIANFIVQGGDFINHDGSGVTSIYGEKEFEDENFDVQHNAAGIISMANKNEPNTNGCQFLITCGPCPKFDNHYVAFGQVHPDSMYILQMIESVKVVSSKPTTDIIIAECGEM